MATAKQLAANRENAKRSTGPRTAAGKFTSSRNALRHGLSLPQEMDAETLAALEGLTSEIENDIDNGSTDAAEEAAAAVLDLTRIRQIRRAMLATMNLKTATLEQLRRLMALDRYERRAMTRRRRASAKLGND
jgi:hypothetical protein